MVRLNQNEINQKQLEKLFSQLAAVVSPKDSHRAASVLSELLGKEERIMIAKRLATVFLLTEGMSRYKIGQTLKLSQSTVDHINEKLACGRYDTILRRVSKTKTNYFAILETLDDILHLGGILPHYNGLDRYRGMR